MGPLFFVGNHMSYFYAGVGSRKTPKHILTLMQLIAFKLAEQGWILRSGAAEGADTAFYRGVVEYVSKTPHAKIENHAEIYIPWSTFGKFDLAKHPEVYVLANFNYDRANEIAAANIPHWENCNIAAKSLHSRNVFQVLGTGFNLPVKMCICWGEPTADGAVKGGTRTAWLLAKQHGAKCINLAETDAFNKALLFVGITEERLLALSGT